MHHNFLIRNVCAFLLECVSMVLKAVAAECQDNKKAEFVHLKYKPNMEVGEMSFFRQH